MKVRARVGAIIASGADEVKCVAAVAARCKETAGLVTRSGAQATPDVRPARPGSPSGVTRLF